jgi:hypothetical protein
MRRMAGLELDGWLDYACRGWPADGETASEDDAELVEGNHASVIVSYQGTTIGGPQAVLSPIGRGGGWGAIGDPGLRRSVAELWSVFLEGNPAPSWHADLRAATDALTRHAQDIVFCIPDRLQMDEARQQAVLDALAGVKRPRVTLLWRPVAMLLGWLETAGAQAREGMRVACLQQASDGIEVQHLTLRAHAGLLVPERDGAGSVEAPHLGLQALCEAAEQATATTNTLSQNFMEGRPRLPVDQLFAPCPAPELEIFRLAGTDWRILRPPTAGVLPDVTRQGTDALDLEADIVLLSTPLAERHHAWLRASLSLHASMQILAPGTAARGCLLAARRIARGIPHYLDRLDQVALVVLRQGVPVFEDLIPAGAIVAGNREYVSRPITNMVWGSGMASAQFFLRKGAREIRRWTTPDVPAPEGEQRLIIQLKQRPAQGWAVLSVGSTHWEYLARNPIRLDWQTLEPDDRPEDNILASLSRPKPTIPNRVHQPPGLLPWIGKPPREGLASRLARFNPNQRDALVHLAAAFRQSVRQQDKSYIRAIGTDGEVPPELSAQSYGHLQQVIEALTHHLRSHVVSGVGLQDNNALLVLTWMFERCPKTVTQELIRALECAFTGRPHVFLTARSSMMVVMHGVGRIVHEEEDLVRLIPQVINWLDSASSLNNGLGLLAALLSRPARTPQALMQLDMDHLAKGLLQILKQISKKKISGSRLKYTLIAIAGLLRIREFNPWALVTDQSPWAASFSKILTEEMAYLQGPKFAATLYSLSEVVKLLQGKGGRPDIFVVLDEIEDEAD